MATLGEEVRRLREEKGLSQAELARASHLGLRFVWDIEHDTDVRISEWHLERLAGALGVSRGRLILVMEPYMRRKVNGVGGAG